VSKGSKKLRRPMYAPMQEGRLRYHAASTTTVVAATPLGAFKLFKITFGRDGSIYLPFPYLETTRGVLSEADPATEPDPKTLSLRRNGIVVDYDVKFAHHVSGVVHFSKTGEEDLLPQRRSFPLSGPIGRVFDFHVFGLKGFATVDGKKAPKDLRLAFRFSRHPPNLHVWGEWRRKQDILENTEDKTSAVGPSTEATRRGDGTTCSFLFLGQPTGYPLRDHLLLISAEEIPNAEGADVTTSIFMGGWDRHEGAPPWSPRMLVFLYPVSGEAPQGQFVGVPGPPTEGLA
jgi:hypothetical protein